MDLFWVQRDQPPSWRTKDLGMTPGVLPSPSPNEEGAKPPSWRTSSQWTWLDAWCPLQSIPKVTALQRKGTNSMTSSQFYG